MRDDPREIASYLIQEYGMDGAIAAATEEIRTSQRPGEFYGLSIWREVRLVLREQRQGDGKRGPDERPKENKPH